VKYRKLQKVENPRDALQLEAAPTLRQWLWATIRRTIQIQQFRNLRGPMMH